MCGWGLLIATIIVLSNLAGVAVTFFYLFLAEVIGNESIATWGDGKVVNVVTTLAFIAIATAVAYRGMTATKSVMYVLVTVQMAALALFAVVAIGKAVNGEVPTATDFELAWLNPFSVETFSALAAALSLSIFMYWGWDAALSACEETTGSDRTPGIAALLSLLILAITYVVVAVAAQMYAGVGGEGVGLGNPETEENVFAALAGAGARDHGGVGAVPGGARQLGLEPADDVHPGGADDARDELLQGAARRAVEDPSRPTASRATRRWCPASAPRSSTR